MGEEIQNQDPEGEPETANPAVHKFMVAKVVEVTPERHKVTFDTFAYDNALAWVHRAALLKKLNKDTNTEKEK